MGRCCREGDKIGYTPRLLFQLLVQTVRGLQVVSLADDVVPLTRR